MNQEKDEDEILTPAEAAKLLKVTTRTLRGIPLPYQVVGKSRRYSKNNLLRWISNGKGE